MTPGTATAVSVAPVQPSTESAAPSSPVCSALAAALVLGARRGGVLVAFLVLPLAIPVVVGGIGASAGAGGRFLAFLVLYDALFGLLAWAAFEYVVSEI